MSAYHFVLVKFKILGGRSVSSKHVHGNGVLGGPVWI